MKALSINVTESPYNALGDDNTDNKLAIQSAIDAIDGMAEIDKLKLEFPKGIYIISGTLTIPSNIEIDFGNATIKRKPGSYVFDMITNDDKVNGNQDLAIKNLIIDGNKDIDNLKSSNVGDRFSGLKLVKTKIVG